MDKERPESVVPISLAFRELYTHMKQSDWESAHIIAAAINKRVVREGLYISNDESNLLRTALNGPYGINKVIDKMIEIERRNVEGLHHDGYPDDSDRDPNTGTPYGEPS